MCFSASASFIASGALVAFGGASLVSAQKKERLIAIIPIFFGLQQFAEGMQWLSVNSGSSSLFFGYVFLFFALILWPVYVPLIVFVSDKKERKVLGWFIFVGAAIATYFSAMLMNNPLGIDKFNSCIRYSFDLPFVSFVAMAYMVVIVGSMCVSSLRFFRYFGILVGILGLISWLFFEFAFISVWCFFAAVVSLIFFFYIKYKKRVEVLLKKVDKKF